MGWRGYEATIPAGMIFRKMYCHRCGAQLKRKKVTNLYKKGEPGYSNDILGSHTLFMSEKSVSDYIYKCPKCDSEISYLDQLAIARKQRKLKAKIISENE